MIRWMLYEPVIILGIISSIFLTVFEIGEIAFFVVIGIFSIAVLFKIIKQRKKNAYGRTWIIPKLLYWCRLLVIMQVEYEEFETVEDIFLYMASAAPPMKNTMPINSYKGYVMAFIPLSPSTGDTYLMIYAKGNLEPGIYEFDVSSKSFKKVTGIERADKNYFVSLTPKRNTIADKAIQNI